MGITYFKVIFILKLAMMQFFVVALKRGKQGLSDGQDLTSSWSKLQISSDVLCSFHYANLRVNVYEHPNNKKSGTAMRNKKYFYAPVARLDNRSAVSSFNRNLKQAEMRFRIDLWSNDLQNSVIKYVSEVVEAYIEPHQVRVMPFEKVILISTDRDKWETTTCSLSNKWSPYRQQEYLWFVVTCLDINKCEDLARLMRTQPEKFYHFRLLFTLSSQSTQTGEVLMSIDNVVNGAMASKLLQKYGNEKEVLLTAKDEKQLLSETMTNILVESFDESDVISPTSKSQMYKLLQEMLVSSRTTISDQTSTMWDSVFWNNDNFRPDKTSKLLTDTYRKLDKTNQTILIDFLKSGTQGEGKLGGLNWLSLKGESTTEGNNSKDNMEKTITEIKDSVMWDGEKFSPKPLSLAKIHLAKLQDRQMFKNKNVKIRYTTAVLSTLVNIRENYKPQTVYNRRTELIQQKEFLIWFDDMNKKMHEKLTDLHKRLSIRLQYTRNPIKHKPGTYTFVLWATSSRREK